MATMSWTLTGDIAEYLRHAGDLLRADPVGNTIILAATESLRASGEAGFGDVPALFGWWQPAGAPVSAAFMHTPPYPAVVTRAAAPAVTALADALASHGRLPAGVNAEAPVATAFSDAWQRRTGQSATLFRRSRLFRLSKLKPPDPAPPGRPRVAGPADIPLLLAWGKAFGAEIGEDIAVTEGSIADRLSYGGFTFWEADGERVSLGGMNRQVAGQARIGPIYTPPARRGAGFGGAVTAAVTQAALADGARDVVLFTDLANPVSNALYQRLGYRRVSDWLMMAFRPAS
jgi:GNAT superfamily N-acetyltransferase